MTRKPTPIDADAAYIRVSEIDVDNYADRDTALRELVSVRTKELRDAAARSGRTIADERIYIDMGITGTKIEKRPGMLDLIAAARRGEFSRIWFRNLSRVFRNLGEQIATIDEIEKAGVQILSLQEPNEGEKPLIDLIRNQIGAVNQYMAAQTGVAIKQNNRLVASMGRYIGSKAPLGYIYNKETKQLLPDPIRSRDLVRLFEIYAETGSLGQTAVRLNALGIPTRDGALWRHKKVKETITNPVYRGRVYYDGQTWPGQHEVIVPKDILEKVDAMLEANKRRGEARGNRSIKRTYSGLLICGLCHAPMRANGSGIKDENYWVCAKRKDNGMCDMPMYRTRELDTFVLEGISIALSNELDTLGRWADVQTPDPRPKRPDDDIPQRRSAIQRKMRLLATEYAEGYLEQTEYREIMRQYQDQLAELDRHSEAYSPRQTTAASIREFYQRFKTEWKSCDEEERRELISAICTRIGVYPDKLILYTVLSIGEVAIPTHFWERIDMAEYQPLPGRFAPDPDSPDPGQNAPGRT